MTATDPLLHPIAAASFEIIDREIGPHNLDPDEYQIARRIIHSTADFEYARLLHCSPGVIPTAIAALRERASIVVDVGMVERAIARTVARTFANPVTCAIDLAPTADPGKTRTETGLLRCLAQYPDAIYAIGNAPTALAALCAHLDPSAPPRLVIGAPVGFVGVLEAKQHLERSNVPQIRIDGRKGGSPVAGAILNALLLLARESAE